MSDFLQLLFNGSVMGCIYALIAVGFILIYNTVGIVNFSQGEFLMIGGFIGTYVITKWQVNVFVSFIIVALSLLIVGAIFTKITYAPLRNRSLIAVIIGTVGVSIALQNLALVVFGPLPMTMPPFFGYNMIDVKGVKILPHYLFVIAFTIGLLYLQYLLFNKTSLGNKLRAVAQDKETSLLMGIRADNMILLTIMISAVLSGFAGILLAPIFFIMPSMGVPLMLKAFAAVVIGGFGSIPGAILGGLYIGLSETYIAAYMTAAYKDALVFIILILFLLFRPQGIFSEKISQKV